MMQDRESDEYALAILGPGKNPFHVGDDRKRLDIDVFHDLAGHLSQPILRESARQRGITLTGRMEPCTTCRKEARDERGGRLAISYISTCAARTPPQAATTACPMLLILQQATSRTTPFVASLTPWPFSGGVSSTSLTRRRRKYGVFVATAIRSGPARTSVTSAPP